MPTLKGKRQQDFNRIAAETQPCFIRIQPVSVDQKSEAKWRADLSWQSLIELRDLLQSRLDHLRAARAVVPPVFRCPSCGAIGPSKPPVISVRAMLISVRRFGIDTSEIVASREHEWARYRSRLKLDLCGQPSHEGTVDPEHASCIRASPGALRN